MLVGLRGGASQVPDQGREAADEDGLGDEVGLDVGEADGFVDARCEDVGDVGGCEDLGVGFDGRVVGLDGHAAEDGGLVLLVDIEGGQLVGQDVAV